MDTDSALALYGDSSTATLPEAAMRWMRRLVVGAQTLRTLFRSRGGPPRLAFAVAAAEARERGRIASGLHDELGQVLALLRFKLGELTRCATHADGGVIQELCDLLAQATEATRHATFELQSPVLQHLGLLPAIENLVQRMHRLCGMNIMLRGELPGSPLPDTAQAIVFRVVRELLLNAHKHAQARQVVVDVGIAGGRLCIAVSDDGVGFERPASPWCCSPSGGYGLQSIAAQMEALGGKLALDTQPGQGTTATLSLPLSRPQSARHGGLGKLFRHAGPSCDHQHGGGQ